MAPVGKTFFLIVVTFLAGRNVSFAYPKIYGNYQFNFQRQLLPLGSNNLYNQILYFNLQDYLMVKNRFLFTAYVVRNEYVSNSKRVDFRPRLDFDLTGTPYKLFFSYLPYALPEAGGVKSVYKQYQGLASLHPGNVPDLRFNWNRTDLHDNQPVRRSDASFRTWSVGSAWTKNFFNAALFYTRQENADRLLQEKTLLANAFNVSGGLNLATPGAGYLSSTYNYSHNEREDRGVKTSTANAHSLTTLYATPLAKNLSLSSNYSGRFSFIRQLLPKQKFQDQTLNTSLSFTPLSRMDLSVLRGDMQSLAPGSRTSQDYWAGTANYAFPVWKAVASKISYSKTWFVQSPQGQFFSDVYYLSLAAPVYPGLQVRADLSVNFRSGALFVPSRYQTSRFLDIRSQPWEKVQLNYYYQSSVAAPNLTFTQVAAGSHNFALNYFPVPTWSATLNYIERFASQAVGKQRVFAGQIYHTFREQYTINVNYNLSRFSMPLPGQPRQSDNLSSQLVLFLERRTVLTFSYAASNLTVGTFSSTLGATVNYQF